MPAHCVCLSPDKSDHQTSVQNGCSQNNEVRAPPDEETLLQCRSRMAVANRKLLEKRLTRKAGNRNSSSLSLSLNFACVSLMVASPSYMDSKFSQIFQQSVFQFFHHRGQLVRDSSSSEFGSSCASCASVSQVIWCPVFPSGGLRNRFLERSFDFGLSYDQGFRSLSCQDLERLRTRIRLQRPPTFSPSAFMSSTVF